MSADRMTSGAHPAGPVGVLVILSPVVCPGPAVPDGPGLASHLNGYFIIRKVRGKRVKNLFCTPGGPCYHLGSGWSIRLDNAYGSRSFRILLNSSDGRLI